MVFEVKYGLKALTVPEPCRPITESCGFSPELIKDYLEVRVEGLCTCVVSAG